MVRTREPGHFARNGVARIVSDNGHSSGKSLMSVIFRLHFQGRKWLHQFYGCTDLGGPKGGISRYLATHEKHKAIDYSLASIYGNLCWAHIPDRLSLLVVGKWLSKPPSTTNKPLISHY